MKNYVQPGDIITALAPYDIVSGDPVLIGAGLFGAATATRASGATDLEIKTTGVFDLAKATGLSWVPGDLIYWDATAKKCTTTATGNLLIGTATEAALSAATVGRVRLNGAQHSGKPGIRATATLDFPSIAAGGVQDLTVTATGAAIGDPVSLGLPAAPNAGVVFNAFVSAADTVKIRASNITGGAIDPASASYTVLVHK